MLPIRRRSPQPISVTCRNKKNGGEKTQTRRQAAEKKGGMEGVLCQNGGAAAGEGGGKERCPAQMPGKRAGWPAFPDVWQEEGPAGNGPRLGGKEGKAAESLFTAGRGCPYHARKVLGGWGKCSAGQAF